MNSKMINNQMEKRTSNMKYGGGKQENIFFYSVLEPIKLPV